METPLPVDAGEPKLLARLRSKLCLKHYSIRTEQACVDWWRRRSSLYLSAQRILAVAAASHTLRIAPARHVVRREARLLFLDREVLDAELPELSSVETTNRPERPPVVPTEREVDAL